ncbi:kinase-like domain-containing protein [Rhizophagus clarus]|uniref:Kinase-like domain-containing protein n=1 Tax=Rhizophagus clarus TaxID=94130 RepID=A0A8H3MAE1_9GLOM|nr:kinase-like domain-containing protein [Rhizophagus clarus]
MELVNANDNEFFDPTPRLKSSPVPILFISFNELDKNCIYCGEEYTQTIIYGQKYCKKCLLCYLTNITGNNLYLDVYLFTKDLECNKHEISISKVPQNIQESCRNCLIILCFKQIIGYYQLRFNILDNLYDNVFECVKYCRLCGKLLYQRTNHDAITFKLCSNCYLISSGYIESNLTKKLISIIYLPWWENTSVCYCFEKLIFSSDSQKYCENCFTLFIGCRYCLTTNIVFGITSQSQCKKCKRITPIIFDITKTISINSGNSVLDDFLLNMRSYQLNIAKFADNVKNIDEYFVPFKLCTDSLHNKYNSQGRLMKYMPYSQFTNVKEIAEGGSSIVYRANIYDTRSSVVALKRFKNSQYAKKYLLSELKSSYHCCKNNILNKIINTLGFTKDPKLNDYIIVMQYASGGDLHNYLQKEFTEIKWNKKTRIVDAISFGLEVFHNANFIHRDFHSGNILVNFTLNYDNRYKIGDLGLSQSASDTSSDNEIYGVIPYIAPEIFKGVEHDIHLILKIIDGERPKITEDTPECYANLMKSCWDPDPKKRPSISDIYEIYVKWHLYHFDVNYFNQAELKRKELIGSEKLGPEFSGKPHPKAIYTSRSLNSYISKCSSINFSSNTYISKELDFDIDIESSGTNVLETKRNIEELNINFCENKVKIGKRIKISSK